MRSLTRVAAWSAAAVLAILAVASQAAAAPPQLVTYNYSFDGIVVTDLCPFPVTIGGVVSVDERRFVDGSRALTAIDRHSVEQDTFGANGRSLTGAPFTYNFFHPFDAEGNNFHAYLDGVLERVPLPGGGVFIGAGRVDLAATARRSCWLPSTARSRTWTASAPPSADRTRPAPPSDRAAAAPYPQTRDGRGHRVRRP